MKFFNVAKAFGFVTPDEGGKDVFVSAAALTAAGIPTLIAGQRLSFDTTDEGKSPKAINLKLIEGVKPPAIRPPVHTPSPAKVGVTFTLYFDASYDEHHSVLAALREVGVEPRIVDYVATPPTSEKLKQLSFRLLDGNPSLARRYEPLFRNLRLDDRFIGQNEFWDAIVEHPSLINGPILETPVAASICKSESAVRTFLNAIGYRPVAPVEAPSIVENTPPTAEPALDVRQNEEQPASNPKPAVEAEMEEAVPVEVETPVVVKPKRGRKPAEPSEDSTEGKSQPEPRSKPRARAKIVA